MKLDDIGAWLKKLGSSQASDLAPVVPFAYHCQCVEPCCNDCSILRPQQRKVRSDRISKGCSLSRWKQSFYLNYKLI